MSKNEPAVIPTPSLWWHSTLVCPPPTRKGSPWSLVTALEESGSTWPDVAEFEHLFSPVFHLGSRIVQIHL